MAELETNSTAGETRPPNSRCVALLWRSSLQKNPPSRATAWVLWRHTGPSKPSGNSALLHSGLRVCPKGTATPPQYSKTYKPTSPDWCRLGKNKHLISANPQQDSFGCVSSGALRKALSRWCISLNSPVTGIKKGISASLMICIHWGCLQRQTLWDCASFFPRNFMILKL